MNFNKCNFARSSIRYLDHLIGLGRYKPYSGKLIAIEKLSFSETKNRSPKSYKTVPVLLCIWQRVFKHCLLLNRTNQTQIKLYTDCTIVRLYIVVIFWHLCLHVFAWWRVVLCFFILKQLLQEVSNILWCYFSKWYWIIFQNASLWCSTVLHVKTV